jgi:hypothetical protein
MNRFASGALALSVEVLARERRDALAQCGQHATPADREAKQVGIRHLLMPHRHALNRTPHPALHRRCWFGWLAFDEVSDEVRD